MAFGARDFDPQEPRKTELRDSLSRSLNRLFDDIRQQGDEIPGARWLGQPAIAYSFLARMKRDGPTVAGVCYTCGYKGVGYWLIFWGGERDVNDQAPAFDAFRAQFKLLQEREKWAPREAHVRPFGGHQYRYQVLDGDGVWSEASRTDRKPEDIDRAADLLLVAKEKRRGSGQVDEANLLIVALAPDGTDPLAQGRKYVEEKWAAEVKAAGATYTSVVTEVTGELDGDPATVVGPATAPVVRLKAGVMEAKSATRLIVVSAVRVGEKVIVARASCGWDDRATYEAKLIQIAGSLQPAE
jgi:hypothetical protein